MKQEIQEISWSKLKRDNPDAYYAFDDVIEGCDFGDGTPDRSS
jgi:hypothetical protein